MNIGDSGEHRELKVESCDLKSSHSSTSSTTPLKRQRSDTVLYLVGLLLQKGPLPVSNFVTHLGDHKCPDFVLSVIGPGIVRFRLFLKQYPLVFQVTNEDIAYLTGRQDPVTYSTNRTVSHELETEAVKFFCCKLLQWQESKVLIHRLASSKSHGPDNINNVVGRRDKHVRHFLERHPEVFKVRGIYVSLVRSFPKKKAIEEGIEDIGQQLEGANEDWTKETTILM